MKLDGFITLPASRVGEWAQRARDEQRLRLQRLERDPNAHPMSVRFTHRDVKRLGRLVSMALGVIRLADKDDRVKANITLSMSDFQELLEIDPTRGLGPQPDHHRALDGEGE